jgi:hypothetical protein
MSTEIVRREHRAGGVEGAWFTASDETLDSHGTIIEVAGWQLDRFKSNPVLAGSHEYSPTFSGNAFAGIPVARAVEIRKELGSNPRLRMKPQFAPASVNPMGPLYAEAYEQGYLNSWSVGAFIRAVRPPTKAESKTHGPRLFEVITSAELIECSAVMVPSNPSALTDRKAQGLATFADRAHAIGDSELAYQVRSALAPRTRSSVDLGASPAFAQLNRRLLALSEQLAETEEMFGPVKASSDEALERASRELARALLGR